ncbi:putative zinc finger protein [Halospina denitrificans]|uniref:Putative zinc finger protein n=1 Tax=Halospina denitrificans TaxID=332522 RepID=A0A4R7JMY6_9GAMM|nr:zf-HC2 domain-containing protein [Halospina denitrificans]TDT39432.1 putative zinc finger protein [Halospina denitrificans]
MTCMNIRDQLIAYAAGEALDEQEREAVEAHVRDCPDCARRLRWEERVQQAVQEESDIPDPSADFESRVLAAATGRNRAGAGATNGAWKQRSIIGGAVAAALVAGIFVGTGMQGSEKSVPSPERVETVEAEPVWNREETVKLAFDTKARLDDVSLTIELPPHVEVTRFPGHRKLTWQVDMEPGKNVIALPLRIAYPEGGEIVAHLGKGSKRRTFVAPLPELANESQEPAL